MEIWKPVRNYEELYDVSSLGNVRNRKKLLKPWLNGVGYLSVSLNKKGFRKVRTIHQLVAESFLNHVPCGYKFVVNHKNFITTDNRVENLEIVSQRENSNKKHCDSSSKYVGVHWDKLRNKWKGQIVIGTELKYLGLFDTEIEAHEYYEKAVMSIENKTEIEVKKPKLSSNYKGVSWFKDCNKWRAYTKINGKHKHIGLFKTEIEARDAYLKFMNL